MKIKATIIAIFTLLTTAGFATSASAETLSVSAGIPLSHSISGLSASSTSGYMAHIKLPFIPIGFGAEQYNTIFGTTNLVSLSTMMYDVNYTIPLVPILNVTIGAGLGSAQPVGLAYLTPATVSQVYLQVGFAPIPFLDVHLSYHMTRGTLQPTVPALYDPMSIDGTMIGLGVGFSF